MKSKDIEIEFAEIKGEFKIIKKLIYIIIAVLFGLLLKVFWTSVLATSLIVGNVVKEVPGQDNLTPILAILLIVSIITGLIMISRKSKKEKK